PLEPDHAPGNRGVVLWRDGPRIEEAAAVIELDLPCGRVREAPSEFAEEVLPTQILGSESRERKINLRGDRTDRNRFAQGILPQIAHQAVPRAFAIGQKNRRHRHDFARVRALPFDKESVGMEWIDWIPCATLRENPMVPFMRLFRVNAHPVCRQHSRFYPERGDSA